ncbi:MAG: hypothetical protein AAGD14_01820 [Planctomycetota bacterium]
MPMDEKRARRLARLRKALALKPAVFVLRHGVLGWGLPVAVLMSLSLAWNGRADKIPMMVLPLAVGGAIMGVWLWFSFTRVLWELEREERLDNDARMATAASPQSS